MIQSKVKMVWTPKFIGVLPAYHTGSQLERRHLKAFFYALEEYIKPLQMKDWYNLWIKKSLLGIWSVQLLISQTIVSEC